MMNYHKKVHVSIAMVTVTIKIVSRCFAETQGLSQKKQR